MGPIPGGILTCWGDGTDQNWNEIRQSGYRIPVIGSREESKKEAVPENRHGWRLYYPMQPFNYLAIDNLNQQKLITSDCYVCILSDRCNG